MAAYLLKRLLLIIPTLFGIMLISFVIIQFAPGGPVERIIAQLTGHDSSIVSRIGGGGGDTLGGQNAQSQLPSWNELMLVNADRHSQRGGI